MAVLREELVSLSFDNRELDKFYCFLDLVKTRMDRRFEHVIDLCAGNGLAGFLFACHGLAERTTLVDISKPKRFSKIQRLFDKYGLKFDYIEMDINSSDIHKKLDFRNSLAIAVHACGDLSDRILHLALDSNLPFALMPCCHENQFAGYSLKNPPDSRLLMYPERSDYFDLVRLQYMRENGYACDLFEIPRKITPKNKVLIGVK